MRRNFDAIGVHVEFHMAPFQDMIKEIERGKFTAYYGGYGGLPFGYGILQQLDSRAPRVQNVSHFKSAGVRPRDGRVLPHRRPEAADGRGAEDGGDRAHLRADVPGDVPAAERVRAAVARRASRRSSSPTYWQYLDIDMARKARAR